MSDKYYALCVLATGDGSNVLAYADSYEPEVGDLAEIMVAGEPVLCEVTGRYNAVDQHCVEMLENASLAFHINRLFCEKWGAENE